VLLVVALALLWHPGLSGWSRRVVFVGLVAVLGLVQPYALLILPVLVLTSLVAPSGYRRHEVLLTGLCAGAGIVLTVPHLLLVANGAVGQPDPPPVTAANLAEELLRLPVGMLSPRLAGIAAAVMLTLLTVGVVVCWRRGDRRQVRCTYFGDPLGVLTASDAGLTAEQAEDLARHISGVAPEHIRCATG
jgi:hypothetical protein